jgi:GNAT superfamily N-acetyltransferase
LLDLIRELAIYEKLEHEVSATEADLAESLFGPRPWSEVFLGCLGETVVGYALYFFTFSTFLARPGIYLEDLFVRTDSRRRGFGTELLRRVAMRASECRCGRLEWTVLHWNEPAIRFYQSLGAEVLPEWRVCRMTGVSLNGFASGATNLKHLD